MKNAMKSMREWNGGDGVYTLPDGTEFPYVKSSDGSDKKRAEAAADRHAAAHPDPEWENPDGTPKSSAQRRQYRDQQDAMEQNAQALRARAEAEANPPDRNTYRSHLERIQAEGPGHGPGEQRKFDGRVEMFEKLAKEEDAKLKEEDRQQAIKDDPKVQDILVTIDNRMAQATDEGNDQEVMQLQQAQAYANEGCVQEANKIAFRILADQLNRRDKRKADAAVTLAEAGMAEANASIASLELEMERNETQNSEDTAQESE